MKGRTSFWTHFLRHRSRRADQWNGLSWIPIFDRQVTAAPPALILSAPCGPSGQRAVGYGPQVLLMAAAFAFASMQWHPRTAILVQCFGLSLNGQAISGDANKALLFQKPYAYR